MCLEGSIVFGANGNGGHARYMKVPVHTLVPLPDALSFETGAAISCGTGTAYGALKRLNLQGGEIIAIFGQGPVGLSATQLAVAMGARVIALDISPERRKLACEFGANEVIDARSNNPVEAIRELTHGEGAHRRSGAARPQVKILSRDYSKDRPRGVKAILFSASEQSQRPKILAVLLSSWCGCAPRARKPASCLSSNRPSSSWSSISRPPRRSG